MKYNTRQEIDKVEEGSTELAKHEPLFVVNRAGGYIAETIADMDMKSQGYSVAYGKPSIGYDRIYFKFAGTEFDFMFAEIKQNHASLSKRQVEFQRLCKVAGVEYFIYRVSPLRISEYIRHHPTEWKDALYKVRGTKVEKFKQPDANASNFTTDGVIKN